MQFKIDYMLVQLLCFSVVKPAHRPMHLNVYIFECVRRVSVSVFALLKL